MKPFAGVICREHEEVDISYEEYMYQMSHPDDRWTCPLCRDIVDFDDDRFEEINYPQDITDEIRD